MDAHNRNFSDLKKDKYDEEGLETVTSKEQVSRPQTICGFIDI